MASDEGAQIVEKARQVGAAAAGIASLQRLRDSPSHEILARFGTKIDGEYSFEQINHFTEIDWPADARSALVISVSHPRDKPELDWSCASGNTLGTQLLAGVSGALTEWLEETLGVKARRMPYWVEEGGVYVKDAAVLAGLGCIGRNNLLVSPECGPRLRLRVMLLDTELAPTGPAEFNPCRDCDERCRVACPREAFEKVVLSSAEVGVDALPGTTDPSAGRDASCRWVRTRRTPAWRSTTGSCRRSICHGRRQRESSMQRGASSGAGAVNLPVLLETDPRSEVIPPGRSRRRRGSSSFWGAKTQPARPMALLAQSRQAHATQLLKAGAHPKVFSERLGHASIGITLDTYSHVLPSMQEEAAERIDEGLRKALAG